MDSQTADSILLSESVTNLTLDDRTDDEQEIEKVVNELAERAAQSPTSGDHPSQSDSPLDSLLREKDSDCEEDSSPNTCINESLIPHESVRGDKTVDQESVSVKPSDPLMEGVGGKFDKKRPQRPRTEKWGESVGITNEDGSTKRVIRPNELFNYLVLETAKRTDSKLYCALINDRFPRFLDSTPEYNQRWRMRYNIFADNVLEDTTDDSLVHIGEIHLYFDLIPRMRVPYFMNSTFYEDTLKPEKAVDTHKYANVLELVDWFRRPPNVLQLKFSIRSYLFNNTNDIFTKFEERQQELMDEARSVFRKAILRRKKLEENQLKNGQSQSIRGPSNRYEDYGQRSRDSSRGNRRRAPNYRRPFRGNRGLSYNFRRDSESNEKPSSYGQNKRYGVNERVFRGTNRSDSRPHRKNTSNYGGEDVTFEDTQERQERSAKTSDRVKRSDHRDNRRDDLFDDNSQRRRTSLRSMDSGANRRSHYSDGQYSSYTNTSGLDSGRHMPSAYSFAPDNQMYSHYHSSNAH